MKRILLLAVVGLLVFASGAGAITWSQAWNKTWNREIWLCFNRGAGLYNCLHPNYPVPPACQATGTNIPGFPQWHCEGQFVQSSNVPQVLANRLCDTNEWWGPVGVLLNETVRCLGFGGIG